MKKLVIVIFVVTAIACHADHSVAFLHIDKDRAVTVDYRVEKEVTADHGLVFSYTNPADSIRLFIDTSRALYSGRWGIGGQGNLGLEKIGFYTVNGIDYKVLKLSGDKDVTDGSFSIFLSPDLGLLITRSDTWRNAMVRMPGKDTVLAALLYLVQTDTAFYGNAVPDEAIMRRFVPPKP